MLHSAPWCSSLECGSSGGARWDVGVGVPAGGRDTGKQGPHPEGKALSSSTVGLCDWAGNYQVSGKYPFLCQTCVISFRVIVPSELSEHLSYR